MKLNKNDAISMCAFLIDKVASLTELKSQIKQMKLTEVLGPDGIMTVVDVYQRYVISKYSDTKLIKELLFWANGGSYKTHLEGFNAISPKILVLEAEKRKWMVKKLSNKVLISSHEFPPITLDLRLLIG